MTTQALITIDGKGLSAADKKRLKARLKEVMEFFLPVGAACNVKVVDDLIGGMK